jgi:hypothetical protein
MSGIFSKFDKAFRLGNADNLPWLRMDGLPSNQITFIVDHLEISLQVESSFHRTDAQPDQHYTEYWAIAGEGPLAVKT